MILLSADQSKWNPSIYEVAPEKIIRYPSRRPRKKDCQRWHQS